MKSSIHPIYNQITITCNGCGVSYTIGSTNSSNMTVDVCSNCHPFFTGNQKIVDVANKAKVYEERKQAATKIQKRIAEIKAKREERTAKSAGTSSDSPTTLKDMMKLLKQGDKR